TFWVKFSGLGTSLIVAKDNTLSNSTQREFQLYLSGGKFGAGLYDNSSTPASLGSVMANNFGQVSTGVWYFVAFRHDSAAKKYFLSVNAGPENSLTYTGTPNAGGGADFTVSGFQTGNNYLLNGAVDALGIWKRSLSSAEISSLYNSGSGMEYPTFALAWQNTNASTGDLQLDLPDGSNNLVAPNSQTNWTAPSVSTYTFTLEVIRQDCSAS